MEILFWKAFLFLKLGIQADFIQLVKHYFNILNVFNIFEFQFMCKRS